MRLQLTNGDEIRTDPFDYHRAPGEPGVSLALEFAHSDTQFSSTRREPGDHRRHSASLG
jgi:hypothetical protein